MSKLKKDQIQKIAVSVLMLAITLIAFFNLVLGPLKTSIATAKKTVAGLQEKVTAADKQIKRSQALEADALAAANTMDLIVEYMPQGAPVAWFPPKVAEFFKRHGFKNVVTRPAGEEEFPDRKLSEYTRVSWAIQLPSADFVPLGIAVAALENQEPFLDIIRMEIITSADDPQNQRVNLLARTVLKK